MQGNECTSYDLFQPAYNFNSQLHYYFYFLTH